MTVPHLMNCIHSGDGWCLDCVEKLNKELIVAQNRIFSLSKDNAVLQSQINSLKRNEYPDIRTRQARGWG